MIKMMQKLNIKYRFIFFIILILIFNNCSHVLKISKLNKACKAYDGNEVPNEEAVIVKDSLNSIVIQLVDGKLQDLKGHFYSNASSILLPPGKHRLKVCYYQNDPKYETYSENFTNFDVDVKSSHIYAVSANIFLVFFEPILLDLSNKNKLSLENENLYAIPETKFEYTFKSSGFDYKYIIEPPDNKKWFMNRSYNNSYNKQLLFYNSKTFQFKSHYKCMLINFVNSVPLSDKIETAEYWLKSFLNENYFDQNETLDISIKVDSIKDLKLYNNKYMFLSSQIFYKIKNREEKSQDKVIVYINKSQTIEGEKYIVFVLINSNYNNKTKTISFSDEDKIEFLKVIRNCSYQKL
jgi:hypothetical protein